MTAAAPDYAPLRGELAGDVVVPGAPAYDSVRKPAIARFDDVRPQAVALCRTPADVATSIGFARRAGVGLAVRSGGHCFAGRSSTRGLLLDVGPMSAVAVADGVITVGAGARLGEIYDALEPHALALAGGCGSTVGIAGLLLGGGHGIMGRRHGLTCDQLLGAELVLADGRAVACDERRHPDLFWALRGAGGGQFGVLTQLTLRAVPAPAATTLHLAWPAARAAAVVDAWQAWAPDARDELAASLLVIAGADPDEPPAVHVFGALLGDEAEANDLLGDFVARVGARAASVSLREQSYRAAKRHLAEHGPGEEPAAPSHGFSRSEFFRRPLPADVVAALVEHLAARRAPGQVRTLDFTPWGGAYNRVRPDATAFAHRSERFLLKHEVAIAAGAPPADRDAARAWLARSWALAHPHGTGGAYVNFPDPQLEDWATAYHGANYDRLLRIKAAYDPDGVFGFPQSIGS